MTAGAREPVVRSERADGGEYGDAAGRWAAPPGCVITADGAYGARLAHDGECWFPERWTLDGPEPYAVPLPGPQPEEPGAEVLPLSDGRVLIHRVDDGRHAFSLLYPTGPGTGELSLGAVECPDAGTVLRLLPPAPDGERAYALAVGRGSTAVWLVAGGAFGPEHLAEVPGHCSGGVWLDSTGRLLALDRFQNGRTKTVVVDLERGGEVSPLLQIAEHSNDRLLLADADSGLLLIRSDAPSPGRDRLGWGVLGSTLPVRFPDCLSATGCSISPFAIQPGQVLTPESCAVALRLDGPGGTWVGVWRPSERRIHHRPAPEGWLSGTGLWTAEGVLRLPYATGAVPCGVALLDAPDGADEPAAEEPAPSGVPAPRPVPLQQAPLRTGRPGGPPRHAPRTDPPRPLPVQPAPRDEADAAVDGPRPSHAGAGHAPEGPEPLSTVTSLTPRTSPAGARWAGMASSHETGGTVPLVVRLTDGKAEPLRPAVPRTPEAAGPVRPSRWTRVPLPHAPRTPVPVTPAPGTPAPLAPTPGTPTTQAPAPQTPAPRPPRRTESAGTPSTEPNLWTKVAETPPPGMGLRTRADGTLPGGMTVVLETAEPIPPATTIGTGTGTGTEAMVDAAAEACADPGPGVGAGASAGAGPGIGTGDSAGTDTSAGFSAGPGTGVGVDARTAAGTALVAYTGPVAGPLPSVAEQPPTEPLPPVSDHGVRTAEPLPAAVGPGLWTRVAETPPPGMSLGVRARSAPSDHTAPGNGNSDAPPSVGEFRGQVALRQLAAVPQAPAESGGPCALAHTDEEKRDGTGEETSPSGFRAMTAR